MKIWILADKAFYNEDDFEKELIRSKNLIKIESAMTRRESTIIKIFEGDIIQETSALKYLESIKESNTRLSKIQAVISDDPWFSKYENFKSELSKYPKGESVLDTLKTIGNEQKKVVSYLKGIKNTLYFEIIDSPEWWAIVYDMIRQDMPKSYPVKSGGYWVTCVISEKTMDKFLKAKSKIK